MSDQMRDALKAVLLWHSGVMWDDETRRDWLRLTGHVEATTKNLCDAVRRALDEEDDRPACTYDAESERYSICDGHHRCTCGG